MIHVLCTYIIKGQFVISSADLACRGVRGSPRELGYFRVGLLGPFQDDYTCAAWHVITISRNAGVSTAWDTPGEQVAVRMPAVPPRHALLDLLTETSRSQHSLMFYVVCNELLAHVCNDCARVVQGEREHFKFLTLRGHTETHSDAIAVKATRSADVVHVAVKWRLNPRKRFLSSSVISQNLLSLFSGSFGGRSVGILQIGEERGGTSRPAGYQCRDSQ
jgi:hypothetical protein